MRLQLQYWKDGDWFVGRLPQVPGVFSQGATLDEQEENIRDVYRLMLEEQMTPDAGLPEEVHRPARHLPQSRYETLCTRPASQRTLLTPDS